MKDLISVIVPIFKAEAFMDRCVNSIVNQTYQNLKIYLVDDCSPDSSGRKCDEWAKKDSRIEVLHLERNSGAAGARNAALNRIDYDNGYIAFVDSDDYIHPRYFEFLYDSLCKESADISWVSVHNTFEKVKEEYADIHFEHVRQKKMSGKELLMHEEWRIMYCMVWGKLYKAHLWEEIRFPETYHYYEDGATTFKVLYNAKQIIMSDIKLYNYFYSAGSATRSEVSEIKMRDGLQTEIDKLDFYTEKKEPQLVEMAYVAYLSTLLKNIQHSRNCKELRDFRKEMLQLYRKSYMHGVRNKNLSKAKRIKYIIYRICPDFQRIYIQLKMKLLAGKKG